MTTELTATGWRALPWAIGFFALFFVGDIVAGILADESLPRPDAADQKVYDYVVDNAGANVAAGLGQIIGAVCLAVVVGLLARQLTDRRVALWGWVSAAAYAACGVLAIVMAAVAPNVSVDTVVLLRDANFLAGGVVTVVALGVFTLLASRADVFSRGVRRFGTIAAALAIASVFSLVFYFANAFLPIGRIACMIWAISAAVSLIRSSRRAPVGAAA